MKYYDFKKKILEKTNPIIIEDDSFIENIKDYSPPKGLIHNMMGVLPVNRAKIIERERLGGNGIVVDTIPEKCGKLFIVQYIEVPFVWSESLPLNESKDISWYKNSPHYHFMNESLEPDGIVYIQDYLIERIITRINSID